MTEAWHLSLFGSVDLRGPDAAGAEHVLVQPKHVALLAHLAVSAAGERQRRFHRRDLLVGLLWPELDQSHARGSLRRVIHQLRSSLGAEIVVSRGDEELALGDDLLRSDVRGFADAIAANDLETALDLYRGELMPGFHLSGCAEFERWLEEHRREMQLRAGAAAWALALRLEADNRVTAASQWIRRAMELAWDDERVLRRALVMLDRLGDRAGALRMFESFSRRLRQEYDAAPMPETLATIEQIRAR